MFDLLAGELALDGVRNRPADAFEVLRHRGLEIAALGDRFASLRIGVHARDDDAFCAAARRFNRLQGAKRRLIPRSPDRCDRSLLRMRGEDGFHLRAGIGDAAVLNVRRHAIDDLDVRVVLEDGVSDHAAHLNRRERVEHEHDDAALAADAVGDIGGGVRRHLIAVAGDIGDEQRARARIHAEHRNAGLLGGLQAGRDLRGIDVDDDGVDLLVGDVLDAADDGRDIALRIDHIDAPAVLLGGGLEGFHVILRARLREIGRDDRDLARGESCARRGQHDSGRRYQPCECPERHVSLPTRFILAQLQVSYQRLGSAQLRGGSGHRS